MCDEIRLIDTRQRYVRKSNEIIQRSRFSLSTQQQKLLLYLISKIDANDDDFKDYEVSVVDYCNLCGIDYKSGDKYKNIKDNIKSIADKSMWIYRDNCTSTIVRWIEKASIESGIIKIRLDNDLKPYLLKLKGNYTSYQIIFILAFNSKYSIRAYELFSSLQYDKSKPYTITYTVDEIRERLDVNPTMLYKNFKSNAIAKAVKEINEYSDRNIEYKENKRGNKVVSITFTISTKSTYDSLKIMDKIDAKLGTNQLSLY